MRIIFELNYELTQYNTPCPSRSVEQVVATATANVAKAKDVVKSFVQLAGAHDGPAPCSNAMAGACMTAPDRIPTERRDELEILVGKYM